MTSFASATPQPETGEVVITYIYDPLYRLTAADYSTGEFYHYTYDQVGNRLTEETHIESHNYLYDDANRLSSVDSVSYTFDDNGNLLSDGTNTYSYDAANRLTSDGTITYAYNGLGDRYQQTASSQTTTYILDLNTGLTQVLDDGDSTYLYGLGRIAQVNTTTDYFMGDALGSVRQLVANDDITLTKSYAPYGEDLYSTGSGESAFAYTGEQTDPNGLVYLRSRYYGPSDGRFLSRDTWTGNANNPMSLNRWNYVEGNPVNATDPMGQCNEKYDNWCLQDPRDLTYWLYREIHANTNDPRLLSIRNTNLAGDIGLGLGVVIGVAGAACANPIIAIAGVMPALGGLGAYALAGLSFGSLVKDHATWDTKHEIKEKLGQGVTFCSGNNCLNDIEYSVAGNIHFGFVARQAGYVPAITNVGAGVAEIADPAHNPDSASQAGVTYVPYNGTWGLESGPFGISFNFGDGTNDHQAVELGIKMFNKYDADMTYSEFLSALGTGMNALDRHSPSVSPVRPEIANQWPYPVGFFDPTK